MKDMQAMLSAAVEAKKAFAKVEETKVEEALENIARALLGAKEEILSANHEDLENARGNIPDVMLDRLRLTDKRIEEMALGVRDVLALKSPVGVVEQCHRTENGLEIEKVRVPMGVVAIIFESRPNVTTDAAVLCLRSGNVCILRGGSEAIRTNTVLSELMRGALKEAGVPQDAVQLVGNTSRESAKALMEARGYVDLLIPRGGKSLIQAVVEGARGVPVIETGSGICHVYVDKEADVDMAEELLLNAKVQRPSVCNSAEVCLVHKEIAAVFLPKAAKRLKEAGVQLRLDERAAALTEGEKAGEQDFDTEFNDYILAVAVVEDLDTAIEHINTHSTGHSDLIVTQNAQSAKRFTRLVDSAAVYVNASTRFTDGGQFGLGCEIGISTQKLGARGPMGLYELTSYKYVIHGQGQIRK